MQIDRGCLERLAVLPAIMEVASDVVDEDQSEPRRKYAMAVRPIVTIGA
jgi:hypothetical protein